MKKVLIISYCFPPINMIAAKRFGIMCKYFEENGYKPYVLTTNPDGEWGIDVKKNLDVPIGKDQIIQIGAHRTNGIVKSVVFNFLLKVLAECKFSSRTVDAAALGWYEKVKADINLVQLQNVDIIVGTFPVIGDLFVACYLSRKLKCPYIADIRDLISDYTETAEGYSGTKLLDNVVEKYVLYKASGIVTVTTGFRDILKLKYPKKRFCVVFNGWDQAKEKSFKEGVGKKYLYYAGSLYLHRLKSIELLIRCMEKINMTRKEKIGLIIRSIGPEALNVKLKKMVKQKGMQEYINILPSADEQVVQAEQEQAYINVVLNAPDEMDAALMATVPGKLYELLCKSGSILAITPQHSDVGKVLQYTNKGRASILEHEIIDFILGGCEKYKGNDNINFFSRKKQTERFCRFMDKILGIS